MSPWASDLANKVSARWRDFIAGYEGGTTLAHCPTVTHRYYRYLRKRGITLKRSMLHALFPFVLDHLGTLNVGSADLPKRIRDRLQMRDALRGYHKQRIKVAAVRHRTRFDDNRWEWIVTRLDRAYAWILREELGETHH